MNQVAVILLLLSIYYTISFNIYNKRIYQKFFHLNTILIESKSLTNGLESISTDSTIEIFKRSWKQSLQGDFIELSKILPKSSSWDNPLISKASEYYENMKSFSDFVINPTIFYFNTNEIDKYTYEINYQLSFTYPMPWRPRIVIPGKAIIKLTTDLQSINSIEEKWKFSPFQLVISQFIPRWWDLWHVFSSPSPEKVLSNVISKINNVKIIEIPEQILCEVEWKGLAKYPGPPLTILPGFSLFGDLVTSKPKRDPFYAVIPVNVKSSRFVDVNGISMKRTTWQFPVPSSCLDQIINSKSLNSETEIVYNDMGRGELILDDNESSKEQEEASVKPDYVTGFDNMENANLMKRVTRLADRGKDIEFNDVLLDEFDKYEKKSYSYKIEPKRYIATVDISGEVTSEKLSKAINTIKSSIKDGTIININSYRLKLPENATNDNVVGLSLGYVKVCFNSKGEPAMAVYEMQYNSRVTNVYLDLQLVE